MPTIYANVDVDVDFEIDEIVDYKTSDQALAEEHSFQISSNGNLHPR